MKRTATAVWSGDLKRGDGRLSTASGVLSDTPYSFTTRFGSEPGTNPEELIAAAHAGCFTMALSAGLGRAGFVPGRLATIATLTMEQLSGSWTITGVHLALTATVPGIGRREFDEVVEEAKANCPVSRVLRAPVTLESSLEGP